MQWAQYKTTCTPLSWLRCWERNAVSAVQNNPQSFREEMIKPLKFGRYWRVATNLDRRCPVPVLSAVELFLKAGLARQVTYPYSQDADNGWWLSGWQVGAAAQDNYFKPRSCWRPKVWKAVAMVAVEADWALSSRPAFALCDGIWLKGHPSYIVCCIMMMNPQTSIEEVTPLVQQSTISQEVYWRRNTGTCSCCIHTPRSSVFLWSYDWPNS